MSTGATRNARKILWLLNPTYVRSIIPASDGNCDSEGEIIHNEYDSYTLE